jgi:hypothetical protein
MGLSDSAWFVGAKFVFLTEPDVIVASSDGGECSKRERTLNLADRIVQDGLCGKSRKLCLKRNCKDVYLGSI